MSETTTEVTTSEAPLYERLGGFNAIQDFSNLVFRRCIQDEQLGRFWAYMPEASVQHEFDNFVDFLCSHWGGQMRYRGRDMVAAHRGMGINKDDWEHLFEIMDSCYEEVDMPEHFRREITDFMRKYEPAVVGSPSYRSVIIDNRDMDVTKGMRSVGVNWPAKRTSVSE